jgi:chromosome segregation ATPase
MSTLVEQFKEDIETINSFLSEYLKKTTNIENKSVHIMETLDNMINLENENRVKIRDIENKLNDEKLEELCKRLQDDRNNILKKHKEYISLIESNSREISEFKKKIEAKKPKLEEIYSLINFIENVL